MKKQGKQIVVDMIVIKDIKTRAQELDALGVDGICVHAEYDLQAVGKNSFEDLYTPKGVVKNAKTAIAGGITNKDDKKAAAAQMQKLIEEAVSA